MNVINTIEQMSDFCESIKVNPQKIFFDSNGTVLVSFHSKKHMVKFAKAIDKYYREQGSAGSLDLEGKSDVADWETNAYLELEASVSTKH